MKTKVCYPGFLLVFIVCVTFTNVSYCIELNPAKEQIEDAIKLGETNPGKKIFEAVFVKQAIFGNWPNYGGGMVKTKLVNLAVMAAMMREARKTLSKEDALGMMESNELTISYRGGDDVFRIKLGQGGRLIEPTKMIKPEMGGKDPKEHAVFIMAGFPYSKLDLDAKATIMVIKDFGEEKYEVDFSRIK
ncbi:MAG: hypothetical protein A3D13_00115 [Planctomycetes bacterium RIFCSPHIGHO2_02_FULL_40_12]|nr:MAG: hypothetical protein A3D13_00115 [Planctomycetes bacterium RIFCSPHIGHO2_02_FULL_40_12]